ncbi:MAG: ATP-binding cassette domain-containing protein, partial [Nitrospirae bacterium]|nr:ATP-binding cassette domain-containing protein [Nitrospirota bacterium]
ELSGGQQQRVIIARAVINEPELLILDEPTTAVDPETREKFFAVIDVLNKNKNTTVMLITHDTGSAGRYASKLLYFDRRVVFYGTFKDFCESTNMAEYFGTGSQHLICHRHD